ncbi:MAG: precorrin-8X methylmutase [Minwuia sp.]|nr:precorrin-8X methylmutase [Minwuia sp.]
MPPLAYERDPDAIYRQSFATVTAESDLTALDPVMHPIATRLIHACGMVDIAPSIAVSDDAVAAGIAAIRRGATILCDARMVEMGIIRRLLASAAETRPSPVITTLNDAGVPALAQQIGNTRSAAAVELWRPHLDGAVVVIGNAPTALFHLLELLDAGWPSPALILGFPVGFVGAAESKAELAANPRGTPFMTLQGRQGGSAIAAAAVNALAVEAAR